MDCEEAKRRMVEARRGRLSLAARADLDGHVRTCDACQHEEAVDAVLSDALSKLTAEPPPSSPASRHGAGPRSARDATPPGTSLSPRARSRPRRRILLGLFVLAALAVVLATFPRGYERSDAMVSEAVNDHVRVLAATHLVETEGTSVASVAPELARRLDFSPVNAFAGDAELPLAGGSVAYFIDRKAAAYVYARDAHVLTVLVFRADGLPWPENGQRRATTLRGFHAVLTRRGDLGYALVSDLGEATLARVAQSIESG